MSEDNNKEKQEQKEAPVTKKLQKTEVPVGEELQKTKATARNNKVLYSLDPVGSSILEKAGAERDMLDPFRIILNGLDNHQKRKAVRFAFTEDPNKVNEYAGIYKNKTELIPDHLIKRIIAQDDLVAAILNARSHFMSAFGRPRLSRFDVGFNIEVRPEFKDNISADKRQDIQSRIDRAKRLLFSCGHTKGLEECDKMNLSTFLKMTTRDGLAYGRFSTEIIWKREENGKKTFHRFRPTDSGTIYRTVRKGHGVDQEADSLRRQSLKALEQLSGIKINADNFKKDKYSWIQVINGQPKQAFTDDEMIVHSLYPVTNVEYNGYPLTPLDTVINSVTTHINITNYHKLYFQNGRATKGMLVFQSDDIDEETIHQIKMQFNASINNVNNSFRMPVFAVGQEDKVTWQPLTNAAKKDGEFEYLSDQNSRVILSAFQMSPDELPGYGHLSRGTNSQALSESSNEYKMEASRSVGARPLILSFQDFLNDRILPLIDPELSALCTIVLSGLDAKTPEQEAIRIQEDSPLHMTMNDVLSLVEKNKVPAQLAGDIPFNERWAVAADKYCYVGDIMEYFMDMPGASLNPLNRFKRDPFWFQYIQFLAQTNPEMVKAMTAIKPNALEELKRKLVRSEKIDPNEDT